MISRPKIDRFEWLWGLFLGVLVTATGCQPSGRVAESRDPVTEADTEAREVVLCVEKQRRYVNQIIGPRHLTDMREAVTAVVNHPNGLKNMPFCSGSLR